MKYRRLWQIHSFFKNLPFLSLEGIFQKNLIKEVHIMINEQAKKTYRTQPPYGTVMSIPDLQATITQKQRNYALTFHKEGELYLALINSKYWGKLQVENKKIYLDDEIHSEIYEDMFEDYTYRGGENYTKIPYDKYDLNILRTFYTIILNEYDEVGYDESKHQTPLPIKIYVPNLLFALGRKQNQSQAQIEALISSIKRYNDIIGVHVFGNDSNYTYFEYYKIIDSFCYDLNANIISFTSPYLEHVVTYLHACSVVEATNKKAKTPTPYHARLIRTSIASCRNKSAIENVNIIVTLFAQTGQKKEPHIKLFRMIERNPLLYTSFHACKSSNKKRLCDDVFSETWSLLRKETDICTHYPDKVIYPPEHQIDYGPWRLPQEYKLTFPVVKK
jgi:hypothetical protein